MPVNNNPIRQQVVAELSGNPPDSPEEQDSAERHRRLWLRHVLQTPQPGRMSPQTLIHHEPARHE